MPNNKNNKETAEPDFSFKVKKIEEEIDKRLSIKEDDGTDGKKLANISDRIREGMEIKDHLPNKGFMGVTFEELKDDKGNKKVVVTHEDEKGKKYYDIIGGLHCLDLRNDAAFWHIRTPILMPQIIKQAIRTHLDIKKCHEPEKRKGDVPLWLYVLLTIGAIIIAISFLSLMMK